MVQADAAFAKIVRSCMLIGRYYAGEEFKNNRGVIVCSFCFIMGVIFIRWKRKGKKKTLSLWESVPIHTEVFREFFENGIQKGKYGIAPILGYDTYGGEKRLLLPFFRNGMQTELFPIQRFALDYWKGKGYYKAKYSDNVPGYFTESDDQSVEEKKKDPGKMKQTGTGRTYTIKELASYSFLLEHFYIVDETTSMTKQELNGIKLVKTDLSAKLGKGEPLVLIYHTHGSETYKKVNGEEGSVIEVGTALQKELETVYGIKTIHDTSVYDMVDGQLDRNAAYNFAGDSVEAALKKNPSVKVVIDLHRDSVESSIHLRTKINGKSTAQIMFFNGVSRLAKKGDIGYLYNPNKEGNLAFSLQMQLLCGKYYPDLTRKIYIKGYRYNLHLVKRAMLVEVGAQNNTVKEAENAMKPLAEMLYRLLSGEKSYKK